MMKRLRCVALFLVWLGLLGSLAGQTPPLSPRESVAVRIDGSDVTIVYGRPAVRDPRTGEPRRIWGGLVPLGRVWRTGANEATLFTTTRDLRWGDHVLPAGSYSLFSVPEEKGGRLIFNAEIGQWGTMRDETRDVLQVPLRREVLRPAVDPFTIVIEPRSDGGGVVRLQWADAQYVAAFQVQRGDTLPAPAPALAPTR